MVSFLKSEGNPNHGLKRTSNIKGEQRNLCFHGTGKVVAGLLECSHWESRV